MKIFNNSGIDKMMQAYRKQEHRKESFKLNRGSKNDELSLSSTAKDYQIAMNALKNTPDIRKEKVEAIKEQIRTGTYVIDSGKIAEKILGNINFDKRV
ncbi:anti-sigma-28 factor, FlgM family [Proteiniborus ethanoligenes]|uniref:Negative regulator of flagellin synthesis n=1 Tax=Proteiniborus ethanoligenes TaxID=415015 RepID=A0A1H3S5W1_9FIRM|nr:flagellar biosynthesis anti-sigma factor FlgM [Proteiniborus ethanoligenes]TAH61248.1 MAG: flagellar biosynthesis anti-sigma factor FlgM [Gottschalkiaceae bacterium]SDZ32985.1 anti-sigma-28 factor, FlgM family [Proteiniborus ethanoligenes]